MTLEYNIDFSDLSYECQESIKNQLREIIYRRLGFDPKADTINTAWENTVMDEMDKFIKNWRGHAEINE